ncbi:MAG: CoA-binding protein, partial [Pseudomonadota bacterium]
MREEAAMAQVAETEAILSECPPEARGALTLLAGHGRFELRSGPGPEGRGEIEIWAETDAGKRLKVGGCETGSGAFYLAHVFLVTQKLGDLATEIGFEQDSSGAGRRFWRMPLDARPEAFAHGLASLLGGGLEAPMGPGVPSPAGPARPPTTLEDLLRPRSIAIVGASDDPTRIGGRPLSHMINQRFDGPVFPVNPRRETVQGLPAYPSLADVPEQVDFVLIAVPAAHVADAVRQAAEKRAKTVLIFSSGFAEVGPEGAALQDELTAIARETGVRIVGPNCLGAFNSAHAFYPTFSSTIDRATPTPGGISIASQSGAYGSHIYFASHLRGLGIRYWLTTGNEADVSIAEAVKLLAEDDDVHTIMAYAESIKDGPLFVEALETARAAKKPVIVMKVGRSETGAQAASSHTASLAGEDAVYDAVLRQHG